METKCDKCEKVLELGDWPFCPHGRGVSTVIPDDIPGGVLIEHGLCNPDGTPHRYYSRSEMDKEAKRRGLVRIVEHVTDPKTGSDKNKHTQRWV